MKEQRQFIKNLRSKLALFLAILLVFNVMPLHDVFAAPAPADDKNYILTAGEFVVDTSKIGENKIYEFQDYKPVNLVLKSVLKENPSITAAVSGTDIKIDPSASKVVDAEKIEGNTGIKLTPKGAGTRQISGNIEIGAGKYTFSFYAKVNLKVDRSDESGKDNGIKYSKIFSNQDSKDPNQLMMEHLDKTYQIKLAGYSKTGEYWDYSASKLHWEPKVNGDPTDTSVITVDEKGVVTAKGAGVADLEISVDEVDNPNQEVKPANVTVVVPFKLSTTSVADGDFTKFNDDVKNKTISLENGSKTLYSNIFDPNDIEWEVKREDGSPSKNELSFVSNVSRDGKKPSSFQIQGTRAGVYNVTAVLKKARGDYKNVALLRSTFKVSVPVTMPDNLTKHMNVGDIYSIDNEYNIGNIKNFTFSSDDSAIAKVNPSTSEITALKVGTTKVTMKDNIGGKTYTITVVVIDKIALSTSDVTIPVGGTIDLNATATDISTSDSWEWISNNPDIAKVEGNGVTAVVKGIAAGETTIVVKHTVGGVIKSATAKVRVTAAVTKITLTPAETTIEVNKIASIRADVTPKTSGGSYLYWRSSNPEIVKIDDENNHTAVTSVTGKAPGIAIIMAVNKENVILGSAKVIVSSPVTGIILSQSVVEKPLSDKTYQIVATVAPKEATNAKLTWKSSNDKVAQVDANGLVTFKKAGHVSIIAASVSNPQITASCDITIVKTVDSIKLETAEISLAVGETYKLSPTISPEDASNKNLNYKSMDPKIADVNKTGLITAKQAGSAHIIVSTPDGKITANCTVKVTQKASGMKLSATVLILDVGASHTLEVTFNPKTTTDTKVLWTISDKSVAKVDAKGKVVAIAAGEALITAKSSNGLTAVCKVKVNQPVGKIELNYTEYDLAVDDELELEVTFDNDDVTNKKVKWKSSKPDVASVDKNGLVKGKKGGIAIITVTADENGMQANCVVTVQEPISEIKLNKTSYILGYHKSFLLKAKLKTNSATNKQLKWFSSKNSVASVNKSGQVYGKKPGFATIKVKATDGSGAEATARIRVVREAGSISANPSFLAMIVGRRKKIKVKISPKNATIKTAKFKSENTDIAMVDSKGRVTALAAGKTKINILAKDNSGKKQAVVVHVRDYIPAAKLTLSNTTLTMGIGDKQSTVYSITPSNTDDKVKWSTNNKAVATVNKKGLITGVGAGNATITASTTSGKTAQIAVTVVGLNFNTLTLEQYDTYKLSVIGDVKNVSWDSENPEIATVENGLVRAKKPGSTTILARVNGAVLRCKVVVNNIQ